MKLLSCLSFQEKWPQMTKPTINQLVCPHLFQKYLRRYFRNKKIFSPKLFKFRKMLFESKFTFKVIEKLGKIS